MGLESLELILGVGIGIGVAYELSSFMAYAKVYGEKLHSIRQEDKCVSSSPKRSRAYLDVMKTMINPYASTSELLNMESSQGLYASNLKR